MKNRLKRGFTLIELMVVVAIIAILMAAGLVAFTNAQQASRNSRRRADMNAFAKAMEQAYTQAGGVYPTAAPTTYFPSGQVPADPKQGGGQPQYNFTYAAGNGFCACAALETSNGQTGKGNATSMGAGGTCAYGTGANANFFCMSQLQ